MLACLEVPQTLPTASDPPTSLLSYKQIAPQPAFCFQPLTKPSAHNPFLLIFMQTPQGVCTHEQGRHPCPFANPSRMNTYAKQGEGGTPCQAKWSLRSPNNGQLLRDDGEVRVACDQWGFAKDSKGGGETVHVQKSVVGLEFGGAAGQLGIGWNDGNGQLSNFCQDVVCVSGAFVPPNRVENLAPVHHAEQQLAFLPDGKLDHFLDSRGPRTVMKKRQQSARIENDSFHSLRSRRRSSSRISSAPDSLPRQPRSELTNSGVSGCRMMRFSSSRKATWVPSRIEYFRRSFDGITSCPFVVTVETSVFIHFLRSQTLLPKCTAEENVSQSVRCLTLGKSRQGRRAGTSHDRFALHVPRVLAGDSSPRYNVLKSRGPLFQ